jgi:hypothetical protein
MQPNREQKIIQAVLSTPQGKEFLSLLMDLFYHNNPYVKGDTHHTAYLLGQREVVAYLRDCQTNFEANFEWKGEE